jgi:hypothetical protein
MFDVLLESSPSRDGLLLSKGSIGSVVAHVALIGAAVAATSAGNSLAPGGLTETVVYIAPPKREPVTQAMERLVFIPGSDVRSRMEGIDAALADGALMPRGGRGAGSADVGTGYEPEHKDATPSIDQEVGPSYTIVQVDSVAERDPSSAAPPYPMPLLRQGIQGAALVQFVVDSTGWVDLRSFRAMHSSHALFTLSVYGALPRMRFRPASIGGRPVRQLVQQEFRFQIIIPAGKPTM